MASYKFFWPLVTLDQVGEVESTLRQLSDLGS